ncbi:hypothetical protein [uncultured Faecalicoccus sp.]|uniref:hypothetical protein n=1 Tax=uncultured Faecalicoccus sp. TaxID=1971760 RepID=UPI0025EE398C|nr:hypothetical protein [uncultured Faecalicoccus sp.]
MSVLNKNGFLFGDALFALFLISLCASLLLGALGLFERSGGWMIHETINKEWFYSD